MENKDFDKLIAEKLSERTFKVSEDAWQRVENQLTVTNTFSLKKFWWVAAVLIVGISSLVMNWDKSDTTLSNVEDKPNQEIQNSLKQENTIQPIQKVETQTQVATSDVTHSVLTQKSTLKKPENHFLESFQKGSKEIIPTDSEKIVAENTITNQELNTTSQKSEINYNELVMNKLKKSKTSFHVDSKDLLQLAETEIQIKQEKTLKEKVVEKVKNSVQEFNIAFK